MIKLLPYILLISTIFFVRCAQQTPLSGGEKDNTPPMLDSNKKVIPANGTLNFSAKRIIIPFNEYIKLKDKDKQILITPFLETPPNIYVKGKKIQVDFKASLEENTTYIINFGNSIVDITEGNEMINYKYVFSTGSYIDSLTYEAVVYDAYNKIPVEGAYVMLYKDFSDSILLKEKPSYFGITDGKGVCKIGNIASGEYKVVTFLEENGNYKWDALKEPIGFTEKKFVALKDTVADTLVVFDNYQEDLKITEASVLTSGKGYIVFNQPLPVEWKPEEDSLVKLFAEPKTAQFSSTRDSLLFYTKFDLTPGEKYIFGIKETQRKVTLPNVSDTTISFKTNGSRGLKPGEDLYFHFSQPIANIDASKIQLRFKDSLIPFEAVQTGVSKITIAADWKQDEDYEINLFPGSIVSYRNLVNDTILTYFETLDDNDFGHLSTSVKAKEGSYIIELIQDGKVKYRDFLEGKELSKTYSNLFPGTYRLRLIFDTNHNKVWDTGNYFKHLFPERVEYYPDPIQIKRGWDMQVEWEITY